MIFELNDIIEKAELNFIILYIKLGLPVRYLLQTIKFILLPFLEYQAFLCLF